MKNMIAETNLPSLVGLADGWQLRAQVLQWSPEPKEQTQ